MKQPVTEKRALRILQSAQIIGVALEVISIEMQMDLTDSRFKNPTANNHLRLVKQSLKGIKSHLDSIVYAKDKEELEYDFGIEMHRLFTHFAGYDTQHLKDFNDRIEKLEKP